MVEGKVVLYKVVHHRTHSFQLGQYNLVIWLHKTIVNDAVRHAVMSQLARVDPTVVE
jgi:hypothetical protein